MSADHLWLDKLESEPECGIDLHSLSLTRMEIFPTITKHCRLESSESRQVARGSDFRLGVLMAKPTKANAAAVPVVERGGDSGSIIHWPQLAAS